MSITEWSSSKSSSPGAETSSAHGEFRWNDLDRTAINTALEQVLAEIDQELAADGGRFSGDSIPLSDPNNPFATPFHSAVTNFEHLMKERAPEWVERVAAAYVVNWEKQGGVVDTKFCGAVLLNGVRPFIDNKLSGKVMKAFRLDADDLLLLEKYWPEPLKPSHVGAWNVRFKWESLQQVISVMREYNPHRLRVAQTAPQNSDAGTKPQSETGTAKPEEAAAAPKGPRYRAYRSPLRRAIQVRITQKPSATAQDICGWLDDEGHETPVNLRSQNDRTFLAAYRNEKLRHRIDSTISKVRTAMSKVGILGQ